MSEAEVPLGFNRMNRLRQSLPLARSSSQAKLRAPGQNIMVMSRSYHGLIDHSHNICHLYHLWGCRQVHSKGSYVHKENEDHIHEEVSQVYT